MKKVPAKRSKKGFTLIELVVVIAILGILAAILIPVIGGFIKRANVAKDAANARNLYNCVQMVLATDGKINELNDGTWSGTVGAMTQDIKDLFGSTPAGDNVRYTVDTNNVVTSASYKTAGQTEWQNYTREGTTSTTS